MGGIVSAVGNLISGPSTPATPDYTGAAQATAAGNIEAAKQAQAANMVNQVTPQGNVNYTLDPSTGQWTQKVSLSPTEQAAFDKNNLINAQLQNVGVQGLGYVQNALNKPLSFDSMQQLQSPAQLQTQASDAAYANATRYLDPQFQRQQSSMENQLANQGITRGSEAWNNSMDAFNANKNNAYSQAQNQAYTQGLTGGNLAYNQALGTRQQQIGEAQTLQQNPLNMLNAVRTGAQLQTAGMPQVNTSTPAMQATTAGADLSGAAQATGQYNQGAYNAQQAANSGLLGGAMGALGNYAGTTAGAAQLAGLFSDRRMKENISKVGKLDNGLNLYKFDYKPEFKELAGHGSHVGVMADEVEQLLPQALMEHSNGYKMVNYGVVYGNV